MRKYCNTYYLQDQEKCDVVVSPQGSKVTSRSGGQVSPLDYSSKNKLLCQTESCIYLAHDIPWDTCKYWKARLFSQSPSPTGRAGTLKQCLTSSSCPGTSLFFYYREERKREREKESAGDHPSKESHADEDSPLGPIKTNFAIRSHLRRVHLRALFLPVRHLRAPRS